MTASSMWSVSVAAWLDTINPGACRAIVREMDADATSEISFNDEVVLVRGDDDAWQRPDEEQDQA